MSNTITNSQFNFPGQKHVYHGKVREVYTLENDILLMIATDRLSAFDVVMPKGIPYKGQILNQIATQMMRDTEDLVPNWLIATPDPNVAIGKACEPFKVEIIFWYNLLKPNNLLLKQYLSLIYLLLKYPHHDLQPQLW